MTDKNMKKWLPILVGAILLLIYLLIPLAKNTLFKVNSSEFKSTYGEIIETVTDDNVISIFSDQEFVKKIEALDEVMVKMKRYKTDSNKDDYFSFNKWYIHLKEIQESMESGQQFRDDEIRKILIPLKSDALSYELYMNYH